MFRRRPKCAFPSTINVDGVVYPINTSYRIVWQWVKLTEHPLLETAFKVNGTLLLFLNRDPHDPAKALEEIHRWLLCGSKPYQGDNAKKCYDFEQDYQYVWSGFVDQYGIDLNENLTMHWWEFKARFDELSEKSKIKQIIQVREMPMPDGKDPEHHMRVLEAKERFALE